jgi:hypothetical protein
MTASDALLDALLDALGVGLRRRVTERGRAERRLADFVFREGSPDPGEGTVPSPADWRHFVARTLAAAGEPGTIDLLERLSAGDLPIDEIGGLRVAGGGDRLATVDRIGGLASAGLVGRDLETDRVGLTDLGAAVLALVREWERRASTVDEPVALGGPR